MHTHCFWVTLFYLQSSQASWLLLCWSRSWLVNITLLPTVWCIIYIAWNISFWVIPLVECFLQCRRKGLQVWLNGSAKHWFACFTFFHRLCFEQGCLGTLWTVASLRCVAVVQCKCYRNPLSLSQGPSDKRMKVTHAERRQCLKGFWQDQMWELLVL